MPICLASSVPSVVQSRQPICRTVEGLLRVLRVQLREFVQAEAKVLLLVTRRAQDDRLGPHYASDAATMALSVLSLACTYALNDASSQHRALAFSHIERQSRRSLFVLEFSHSALRRASTPVCIPY